MSKTDERFVCTYNKGSITRTQIWVDKITGVNYLYIQEGYGAGLSPLLDKDGKPVITPV